MNTQQTAIYIGTTAGWEDRIGKLCIIEDDINDKIVHVRFVEDDFPVLCYKSSLKFDDMIETKPSANNAEICVALGALTSLVSIGRIPPHIIPRIIAIGECMEKHMDATGDCSAEDIVEYLENKFKK